MDKGRRGKVLVEHLSSALGRKVGVGRVQFVFPTGFVIHDLKIEGLREIKEVWMKINPVSLWQNRIELILLKLKEPHFAIVRTKENKITFVQSFEPAAIPQGNVLRVSPSGIATDENKPVGRIFKKMSLKIRHLVIDRGRLQITDNSAEKSLEVVIGDVNLEAKNIVIPWQPAVTSYALTAFLRQGDFPLANGKITSGGWVDFSKKDMDAVMKLEPLDGTEILSVKFKSKNNDLSVQGRMKLSTVIANFKEKEESPLGNILLRTLQASGLEVKTNFAFKTKMDDFQVASVAFSGSLGYEIPSQQDMMEENKTSIAQHLAEFRQKMVDSNDSDKDTP